MKLAPLFGILLAVVAVAGSMHGTVRSQPATEQTVEEAIRAQLPDELPPRYEAGWPQHAFTLAITWHRVGEHQLAIAMADELWDMRDANTGLWRNAAGYIDGTNPFFATLLYALVGHHDRAVETSENVIAHVRKTWTGGAYNEPWLAALSATIVGQTPPSDLMAKAQDGLYGRYSTTQGETSLGRYYSDIMRAYWCITGGLCWEYLSDETDYCPSLGIGQRECESFYAWARGEPAFPDLQGMEYSFWTDGILFYALAGFGIDFTPIEMPFGLVAPNITNGSE